MGSPSYPLMLDVSDRPVVIVGGGRVAARKAVGVLAAGARQVRVVSTAFADEMPPGVERVEASYRPEHLDGAGLVFAATDVTQVNEQVVRDARTRSLLVSRVDGEDDAPGDFTTPAVLRLGALVVAISASGSPALAAKVRDELALLMERRWVAMADALMELRPMIRDSGRLDVEQRRSLFRELASDAAMDVLTKGGHQGLWRWIVQRFPALAAEKR